ETPAWFEVPSLADITTKQEQQADGITASVEYLLRILDGEVVRLKGAAENVVLCGISQGAAVGLWALLIQYRSTRRIGGFIGASCWLPFASDIEIFFSNVNNSEPTSRSDRLERPNPSKFVESMTALTRESLLQHGGT